MLSERRLTYHPVGATVQNASPPGFRADERTVCLGAGTARWTSGRADILTWAIKTRSGFAVDDGPPETGRRYWLTATIGPLRIREPVEVVAVIDEPGRAGFAYGTLTGHPVSGEELFLVERHADGTVWLRVRSLTRPASGLWHAAYPLLLVAQRRYKRRYLRALRLGDAGGDPAGEG